MGQSLAPEFASGERDRWGRHPAVLASPSGSAHTTLAADLIVQGFVRAEPSDMPRECRTEFLRLEAQARAARRGLWADPAYAIIDASRSESFAEQGSKIVLAEGAVVSTGQWRTLTFLNFGRGRGGASVAISRSVLRELEQSGIQAAALKGKRIRVRGQLALRQSPRIELLSAAGLELTDENALTPAPHSGQNGN